MNKMVVMGCVWWAGMAAVGHAAEIFSQAVSAGDFSAAGLHKLSKDELGRLDKLVRDYQSGALAAAQRDLDRAEAKTARVEAEARTARVAATKAAHVEGDAAREKKTQGGLLAKAKVLLTPGTEVEYATVESRIAGNFSGWDGRAVLTLENGQKWQIANGGNYSTPPVPSPKVRIVPASLGGFWMTIEGVSNRVRVAPIGGK